MAQLIVIGGDGGTGELNRLRNLAERLNITEQCQFLGPVYGEEKKQIFMNSDIFLLPSYAEGQPVTILEAMAAGLPIIASNVGAIPDVVQDGKNGLIIEPGDIPALTRAIDQLVGDASLRHQMGRLSRQQAYQFDVKPYVEQLLNLYAHVSPTV
jgi:glycosyltransferase involved in cell wall biosynthesis